MAISFVGSNSGASAANADLTVNLPVGVTEGDIASASYTGNFTSDPDQDTVEDYVEQADLFANDNSDTNFWSGYRLQGATPDTSVTFLKVATNFSNTTGLVIILRGVDQTTPADATATTDTGINGGTPDPPSITPVTDGVWIEAVGGSSEADNVTSGPTNYDLRAEHQGLSACNVMSATRELATAAPEDPGTFADVAGTDADSWAACTKAWRPAAGGGATEYELDVDAASYTWTPTAAALEFDRAVIADAASWAWNAQDVTLEKGIPLSTDSASYAWSATDAALEYNRVLEADAASWQWSAQTASLEYGREVAADSASWAWSAQNAGLEFNRTIDADAASWTWTAQATSLEYGRVLAADSASWAWTANDATLEHTAERTLDADSASWSWSVTAAGLEHHRSLAADSVSWAWSVQDVTLTVGAIAPDQPAPQPTGGWSDPPGWRRKKREPETPKELLPLVARRIGDAVIVEPKTPIPPLDFTEAERLSRSTIEEGIRGLSRRAAKRRRRLRDEDDWLLMS